MPVYLGAPDVAAYIPDNCFIDFRKFQTYEELDSYLQNVDEKEYDKYIRNIRNFIASEKYNPFTQEKFAKDIINILQSYF